MALFGKKSGKSDAKQPEKDGRIAANVDRKSAYSTLEHAESEAVQPTPYKLEPIGSNFAYSGKPFKIKD